MLHTVGLVAASTMLAVVFVSAALAQTLTKPNPQTKISSPHAKSLPTARMKSCSLYGAGFVNVPGTDACIKVGGYVTVEGTAKGAR
jgi:Porin subfamily